MFKLMTRPVTSLVIFTTLSLFLAGCSLKLPNKREEPGSFMEEEVKGVAINNGSTIAAELVPAEPSISPSPVSEGEVNGVAVQAEKTVEELIKETIAKKYSRPQEEILIIVDSRTNDYAKGTMALAEEMGNGWWLAAKVGKDWQLVAEGNGTIACASIEAYNFPAEMVPECYDQESGEMINRR